MWRCVPATLNSPEAALAATPCPHSRACEATASLSGGLEAHSSLRRVVALCTRLDHRDAPTATCKRSSQVSDISLEDYIAVKPKFAVYVPHTAGRYQKKRFRKAQCPIVERYAPLPSPPLPSPPLPSPLPPAVLCPARAWLGFLTSEWPRTHFAIAVHGRNSAVSLFMRRLTAGLMMHGRNNGKKIKAVRIVLASRCVLVHVTSRTVA